MQLKSIISENELLFQELCKKNDEIIINLLTFWKDKIKLYLLQFSNFENIFTIINETDKMIKKFGNKIANNEDKSESELLEEKYEKDDISNNRVMSLRASMPINSLRRKSENNDTIKINFSYNIEIRKSQIPTKKMSVEIEGYENEKKENKSNNFLKYMYSSKILFSEKLNISNNEDEEDKNEGKNFLRFCNKKSATVGGNTNNLEIKLFNYQEELKDNNFITKMKKSKPFLNFIDIDLFLQYIALDKKFYEFEEENNYLIEGFCLQYQTFIFPETLINKIISCFDYFYSIYLNKENQIIEEKSEDEEEKEENKDSSDEFDEDEEKIERNIVLHRRNAFKIRKRINSFNIEESTRKIPFGLIDFLYTFINIHNTYFHNELSHDVIKKMFDFLKRLIEINEIKEKYEQTIELSQIELKEYESSIKIFNPKIQNDKQEKKVENLSSSDELCSEDEKEIKDSIKKDKNVDKNNEIKEEKEKQEYKEKKIENNKKEEKVEKELKKDNDDKKEKEDINLDENIIIKKACSNEKIRKIEINQKVEDNNDKKEKIHQYKKSEDYGLVKKTVTFSSNKTFKLTSFSKMNENKFINIYINKNPAKSVNIATEGNNENSKNKSKSKSTKKSKSKNKKNKKEKKEKEKPYEFDILKYKTLDIATELARVNYALFSKIKVKEFLKGAFNGKDKYKLSPYICKIIKRFNTISTWVTEEILAYDHAEKRSNILLKYLKICTILKKIGDFDDCLSILTGVTNYNISKLHKTWGHIPSDEMANFRQMKKLLSFEGNWKNLRKEVEQKIKEKSFFVPYLGYYTKRMMYLEEMGPYIKKNTSLINIEKIVEVYKTLKNFYQIKTVKKCKYECTDENIRKELEILQCLEPSNEDFLIQTSNLLEPKFILSSKKLNIKRRTKTDINFLNNLNKIKII